MKCIDLFGRHPFEGKRKPKRPGRPPTPATRRYVDEMPWRTTARGKPYSDPERVEAMLAALNGDGKWGDWEARLADCIAEELHEGRLGLRVWRLRQSAPSALPDGRIAARQAQRLRRLLSLYRYPFTVSVSHRVHDPLRHGALILLRPFALAWPGGQIHGAWTGVDSIPLVVGGSTARASWAHLCKHGSLAIAHQRRLYVWRQVRDTFPTVYEFLRRRGVPTGGPFDAPTTPGQFS